MMDPKRVIGTFTGKPFDFWAPTSDMICIEDIAHMLALTNRYRGATRVPYSVAEHCVRMSYLTVGDPLLNLLHDAAEAYIGDQASPQKRKMFLCGVPFANIEDTILYQIFERFWIAFPAGFPGEETKRADRIMLATEVRDLIPEAGWPLYATVIGDTMPDHNVIEPWPWEKSEQEYLRRFKELTI